MPHHTASPSSSSNGLVHQNSAEHQDACRVCGDTPAKMHYGVLACFGCKGFFRRTLKRPQEYACRYQGKCIVDRHERNSCRFCRFRKCIDVGMDPKAVRPDRDATGRHLASRLARRQRSGASEGDQEVDSEWTRKLPVDMRTTLMQLMNIELLVTGGDVKKSLNKSGSGRSLSLLDSSHQVSGGDAAVIPGLGAASIYPIQLTSLRALLEDPTQLDGKRTEMRYEGFVRVSDVSQLVANAHRGIIAAVDWIDHLFDLIDIHTIEDKMLLVKYNFAALMVFATATATSKSRTTPRNVLNLANYGFVPADVGGSLEDAYHLSGRVVPRIIEEVVAPLRQMHLKDEEAVLFKAIIMLNPQLRGLTQDGSEAVADLRDRIQETLYHVVRETHPKEVASSRFGNILLLLPSVTILGNMICENLSFMQSVGTMADGLMADLLTEIQPSDEALRDQMMMDSFDGTSDNGGGPSMNHSDSCSSLESLDSHSSYSSRNSGKSAGQIPLSMQAQPPTPMTYNYSSPALSVGQQPASQASSSNQTGTINPAASLPNLGQLTDSDPDYNLTLTPDMFSGIRQAMGQQGSQQQQQQQQGLVMNGAARGSGERLATPPNSPDRNGSFSGGDRPTFYIESSRHKFAVTTTPFNGYPSQNAAMTPQQAAHAQAQAQAQQAHNQAQAQAQNMSAIMGQPPPQQTLCKSNSLPQHYTPQLDQWAALSPYPPQHQQQPSTSLAPSPSMGSFSPMHPAASAHHHHHHCPPMGYGHPSAAVAAAQRAVSNGVGATAIVNNGGPVPMEYEEALSGMPVFR